MSHVCVGYVDLGCALADHHPMPLKGVLEFDSLQLSFSDKTILSSIYMKCEAGEIVGLLGRNGTGKSSLMKIVFGILSAEFKSVRINGATLFANNGVISYLPQHPLIPPYLSVREAFELFHISCDSVVGDHPYLKDFLDLKPGQLSGGYRRLMNRFPDLCRCTLKVYPHCFWR